MEAIVLAGGFGTRLSHIVKDVPKPMAPINNIPFLQYILSDIRLKRKVPAKSTLTGRCGRLLTISTSSTRPATLILVTKSAAHCKPARARYWWLTPAKVFRRRHWRMCTWRWSKISRLSQCSTRLICQLPMCRACPSK